MKAPINGSKMIREIQKESKKNAKKKVEFNPYCEKCGGCGYVGCCGVEDFLKEHVKGKTDCKNEASFINEIEFLMELSEDEIPPEAEYATWTAKPKVPVHKPKKWYQIWR